MPGKKNNNPSQDEIKVECYICKTLGLKPSRVMLPLSEAVIVPNAKGPDLYRHKKHKSATIKKFQAIREQEKQEKQEKQGEITRAEMEEIKAHLLSGAVSEAVITLQTFAGMCGMSVVIMFESKE